jgi:Tfp pilus assembly protein PilN
MININLIAERRARKIREMAILRMSSLAVVIVVVFAVALNALAGYSYFTAQQRLKTTNQQLADIQPQYNKLLLVRQQVTARVPVVKLLQQVQLSEGAWMTILADLSNVSTSKTVIDGFSPSVDDKGVSINLTGHACDEQAVAAFMLAIPQETGWAGIPTLHTVSASDNQKVKSVQFSLNVPVRGLVGGNL